MAGSRAAATPPGGTVVVHGDATSRLGLVTAGEDAVAPPGPPALVCWPAVHARDHYVAGVAGSDRSVEAILHPPDGRGPFPAVLFAHGGPTVHAEAVREPEVDARLGSGRGRDDPTRRA